MIPKHISIEENEYGACIVCKSCNYHLYSHYLRLFRKKEKKCTCGQIVWNQKIRLAAVKATRDLFYLWNLSDENIIRTERRN